MSLLIRTQQHWLPRSIDALLTLVAWLGLLYLLVQGVTAVTANGQQGSRLSLGTEFLLTLDTLLIYLVVALMVGAALLVWAKYNERRAYGYERRERMPDVCEVGLSENFQVSLPILDCLQNQQVLILHNHEHGALAAIEFPGTALSLPALASDESLKELHRDELVAERLQLS
jgi:biofilm PGA synthesis protein PgaD